MTYTRPLAITMWDFSWLERRWPGAGYEDWDLALSELKDRGYDAVRIDAYPHLVSADPDRTWDLLPCWNCQDWGSPARNRVRVQPHLNQFLAACKRHGILVALSTWFREDTEGHRRTIASPQALARIWVDTLRSIDAAGLLDTLLYVDLCNEWPLDVWAPFLYPEGKGYMDFCAPRSVDWMRAAVAQVRAAYPALEYTFSSVHSPDEKWPEMPFLDFIEPHIWMVQQPGRDGGPNFNASIGYTYQRFDNLGYDALQKYAEPTYRSDPAYWQGLLTSAIQSAAQGSLRLNKPLITTECWGIVDYKDWPLLDWGWVKELCDLGTRTASATGRWKALATSNFCGPQFRGMWRDIPWHRRLTDTIHAGKLPT